MAEIARADGQVPSCMDMVLSVPDAGVCIFFGLLMCSKWSTVWQRVHVLTGRPSCMDMALSVPDQVCEW